MDKNVLPKLEPGIYSTSLVDVDHNDVTTYHPLKKQVQQHQLTVEAPTAYNYRSRANTNIIERRFSNVEQPILTPELVCKYEKKPNRSIKNFGSDHYYQIPLFITVIFEKKILTLLLVCVCVDDNVTKNCL
ncbi:unnamed protein product [Adineta steineri]|nr:unnamed protein product [Adineta steineri]